MGTPALIGLGSNLGDRMAQLSNAVAALADTPGIAVRTVSQYHETAPVGGPGGQGAFLNAAALLDSMLDPFALHARLQQIESDAGRLRSVRWGERTLDLDLLLFSDRIVDTADLTIPHLRMAVRRFVLAPASEVAPDLRDPLTHRTVRQLLDNLDRRPSILALTESIPCATAGAPLFEDLVRSLDALGLSPEAADRDAHRTLEGPLHALQAGHWPRDRWVVLNSWSPELLPKTDRLDGPLPARRDHDGLTCIQEPPLRPTFVVVAGEAAEADLSSGSRQTAWALGWTRDSSPDSSGVPFLRVRGTSRESPEGSASIPQGNRRRIVAEVLAACEASRAGLNAPLPTLPTPSGPL